MSVFISLLVAVRREIWRKARRTRIAIYVTAIGLGTIIFMRAVNDGFSKQVVETSVNLTTGHIQVMPKDYLVYDTVDRYIAGSDSLTRLCASVEHVTHASPRIIFYGQIRSKQDSWHVMALGISPQHEISAPFLQKSLVAGEYLTEAIEDTASILVGVGLANLLDIQPGSRVGLITQPLDGKIGVRNYRVKGIYKTYFPEVDNSVVYIKKESAQSLLNYGDKLSKIALLLDDPGRTEQTVSAVRELTGGEGLDVMSWREVMPNLAQVIELNDYTLLIINGIVFVVVAISIMNVILISVIERTSELGIILAIGAKRRYVVWMVLAQGLIISMIGAVIGLILGCGVVQYFNGHGLDLARFERGFSSFIGGTVLYPILGLDNVIGSTLMFLAITVLVSLYPAIIAARLMPVEAIRKG